MTTAIKGRTCPVCASPTSQRLHRQELLLPDQIDFPNGFDVVACAECEMVYSDIAIDADLLARYYAMESYTAQHWGANDRLAPAARSSIDQERLSVVADYLDRGFVDYGASVLEIGCASGGLLSELRARGFSNLSGIDPSPAAVASAQIQGLDVQVGTGVAVPSTDQHYDLVIANHVMEHLVDTRSFVSDLYRVVAPGGHCYIEVPDAARFALFFQEPFVDFNLEHINHYSRRHLEMSLGQAGFSLRDNGERVIHLAHDWPYPATFGLWQKAPAAEAHPADTTPQKALHESLTRYVEMSLSCLKTMNHRLVGRLGSHRDVAVRGLGHRAWQLLASPLFDGLNVVAYIDASPQKQALTIGGRPIVGPEHPLGAGIPVIPLSYHLEGPITDEYARTDPEREVIALGRSKDAMGAN